MMIGNNDTIILRFKSLGVIPLTPSTFQGEGWGEGGMSYRLSSPHPNPLASGERGLLSI
jgi:hypothetical protein